MLLFKQSEATAAQRRVPIHLVDATDGITPETGVTGTPQISKNGGAFANTTNALVEVGNGLYYVELTATELDALGFIAVRFKSAATAEAQVVGQVVPFDPYDAGLGILTGPTLAELAQAVPPATPTFEEAVMFLYMALRNKLTVTSTEKSVFNDAGTKIAKATLSDDGTTFTKDEFVSGP